MRVAEDDLLDRAADRDRPILALRGPIPFNPLPTTEAERRERAERADRDVPSEDITRLNLNDDQPPR